MRGEHFDNQEKNNSFSQHSDAFDVYQRPAERWIQKYTLYGLSLEDGIISNELARKDKSRREFHTIPTGCSAFNSTMEDCDMPGPQLMATSANRASKGSSNTDPGMPRALTIIKKKN